MCSDVCLPRSERLALSGRYSSTLADSNGYHWALYRRRSEAVTLETSPRSEAHRVLNLIEF